MKRLEVSLLMLAATLVWSQQVSKPAADSTPVLVLTADEKFAVRTAQANLLQAQVQVDRAQKAVDQAANEMNVQAQNVYIAHNLKVEEYTLCAGPGPAECADAVKNDIVFKAKAKPAEDTTKKNKDQAK